MSRSAYELACGNKPYGAATRLRMAFTATADRISLIDSRTKYEDG